MHHPVPFSAFARLRFAWCLALFFVVVCGARAATPDANIVGLDRILKGVKEGQQSVAVGDMVFDVSLLRAWRDHLAARGQPGTQSAFAGGVVLWPGGVVPYAFDASVSVAHRQSFIDAANEWTAFANLTFVLRTSQTNHILVKDGGPGLFGGNSFVGVKIPGPQDLNIGSASWNRSTLCHEIGHALGLVHEHQRSDRDTFVTIIGANISGGASNGNFVLLPSSNNQGAYDFLSVMHYAKNTFSTNAVPPGNTIEPKPAFAQFLNLMGTQFDRVLSKRDRDGMAAVYGLPPIVPGPVVRNTRDSGPGSLRTAIYYAIDNPGTTISFNIPAADPGLAGGVFSVKVTDGLPKLGAQTTLDATTQAAFGGNTNASGPEVTLDGSLAVDSFPDGLKFTEANSTVRGLTINAFASSGVRFTGAGATGNTIAGCYIGTNAAGTVAVENKNVGVNIDAGASGNVVGGSNAADRNVVSGNRFQGITIQDSGTNNNAVRGNYIGLNAAGTAALMNNFPGVNIYDGAQNNTIGGTTVGARNVISGNKNQGVAISGAGTSGNVVLGNFIGLNAAGSAAVGNGFADPANHQLFPGVGIFSGATSNLIGGIAAGAGNVISGNAAQGVSIADAGTNNNRVEGNFVGLNAAGTSAVANGNGDPDPQRKFSGIELFGGVQGNVIGARNVVSGGPAFGIVATNSGTNGNFILGNYVGTNAAGTAAIGNARGGIGVFGGAQANVVGGTTPAARNVVSGNVDGVIVTNSGTNQNIVQGNFIGVDVTGAVALPNTGVGVGVYGGAQANTIGGSAPGAGNVISGNGSLGVLISNAGTNNNVIAGNFVGVNAAGTAAVANLDIGVGLYGGTGNTIGGSIPGSRNIISGNAADGVVVNTSSTLVAGNTIGWNAAGTAAIPNALAGVTLFGNINSNIIGGTTPGAANLIAGNLQDGVALYGFGVTNVRNPILGNSIFGNGGAGIALFNGANNGQAAPSLSAATLGAAGNVGGIDVAGNLSGAANTLFRVEFFANPAVDNSGFGEGRTFLGAGTTTTTGAGTASFTASLAAPVPAGYVIAATATDPLANTSAFSVARIVTTTDTDGDGLPNNYETANTLLVNTNDASLDADGDGESNLDEFRAGTNPRNPASVLRLPTVTASGGNIVLTIPALLGRTYRVEYADDLAVPNPWRLFANELLGTGAPLPLTDPGAAALQQRFYRALLEP